MTLFGCSTIKEIAAYFNCLFLTAAVFCFISVPYPYCYYLSSQEEDASELRLYFLKNEFFLDCSREKSKLLETNKNVSVFLDGKLHKRILNEDACLEKK